MRTLFIISLVFAILACKQITPTDKAFMHISKIPDSMVVINQWQILGPFSSETRDNPLNRDNLKQFGLSEDSICFEKFLKITKTQAKDTSMLDSCFSNKYVFTGKSTSDFKEIFKIKNPAYRGTVYSACLIICKKDIETYLHFASNATQKIWLNNKLICQADYIKKLESYEQFIPVKLNKGKNFLLVKTTENRDAWEMYARLENFSETAQKRQLGHFNQSFLKNNFINTTDTVQFQKRFPSYSGRVIITDNENNILISDSVIEGKNWEKPFAPFNAGVYHAQFRTGKINLVHDFYKGNLHDSVQKIINVLQNAKTTGKIKNNIDALVYRYKYLLTQTWLTDPKFIPLFIQLNNANKWITKGKDPFHHTTGCHIRSYISDIDSSMQYYILHVPSKYKKNKAAAIAVILPAIVNRMPYLESFRVANFKLINYFQSLAEKHNIIIVEPGSRRYDVNKNTIEEKEFFAFLKDIETDYTIDNKRIYLSSTCSGGNDVFLMATRYPGLFAAVGVVSPEIIYANENARLSPVLFLKNIINTPVYNTHSLIDRHVALERSELLYKIAGNIGMKNFKYDRIPNEYPMFYSDDFFDEALEFCSKYTLNISPKEIDFSTCNTLYNKSYWITLNDINVPDTTQIHAKINIRNTLTINKKNVVSYTIDLTTLPYNRNRALKVIDNGRVVFKGVIKDTVLQIGAKTITRKYIKNNIVSGPFSEIYTKKFYVVKGTIGNITETLTLDSIAQKLNQLWNNKYIVSLKIKTDTEITEKDIADANLILLGNYNSNLILKRLQNELPLWITPEGIKIHDKFTKGEKLGFYMIYPNPLNKDKYIGIAGYNSTEYIRFDAYYYYNISNHGWYDYKVWDAETREKGLISGYFNQYWELK
jgi:hypothetical protein